MLSNHALKEIDRAIAKYPLDQKQSAVMAALAVAQDEVRCLSPEVLQYIATYLQMPAVAVQEVATFYNMYDLQPTGRYKLTICTNLPCALSGATHTGEYLKKILGIDYGQTTSCGTFTLKEGECMGACGDAPVMLVNNKQMCSKMSNEKIDALLAQCKHTISQDNHQ
ncbi:MAG: NADH-quinone oxidoreductase subunit NuoE [Ottowia sp.]|jgi:NADH-quinone oxidoreductase subunit E|nr:NADH-quinone oxidoreductase subunit NuoE [Ottowia sp.]